MLGVFVELSLNGAFKVVIWADFVRKVEPLEGCSTALFISLTLVGRTKYGKDFGVLITRSTETALWISLLVPVTVKKLKDDNKWGNEVAH